MLEVNVINSFYSCPPEKHGIQQIHSWQPAPARKLIQLLGIDEHEVGLITVNGEKVSLDEIIPSQAKITIWPFFFGG